MYSYFWEKNKIFFAVIFGAVIIGGFVYFALKGGSQTKTPVFLAKPKIQVTASPQNLSQQLQIKSNSVVNTNKTACGAAENTIVTKVIDGDTVVVEGGWHIRLLGMDADEKGYPCYDPARIRLENLVLGKQVTLEKDKTDVDQYRRCLRYIFVGSTNVDLQLVQEGLAVARFYEPDVKYKDQIAEAEKQAIAGKAGCKWSGAPQTKSATN